MRVQKYNNYFYNITFGIIIFVKRGKPAQLNPFTMSAKGGFSSQSRKNYGITTMILRLKAY